MLHPYWFGGPRQTEDPTNAILSAENFAKDVHGRYTHVYAMSSLSEILMIFQRCGKSPETVMVSVYEVDPAYAVTFYDYEWASKQILFDRTKATLVEHIPVATSHFRGDTYDVCPPELRKPQ